MSSVSGPTATPPRTYEVAMLRKVKEQRELEGEAILDLLQSTAPTGNPAGTATMIDEVA